MSKSVKYGSMGLFSQGTHCGGEMKMKKKINILSLFALAANVEKNKTKLQYVAMVFQWVALL